MASVASAATTITSTFTEVPTIKTNFYADDFTFEFTLAEDYTIAESGSVLAAYWGTALTADISGNGKYSANAISLSAGATEGTFTLTIGRCGLGNYTLGSTNDWKSASITSSTTVTYETGGNGTTPAYTTFADAIQVGVTYTLAVAAGDHSNIPTLSWVDEMGVNQSITGGTYTGNMAGYPRDGGATDDLAYSINPGVASVPEPTTATLSLLALCGLAARRRRK